jgi:hypothetical protein
MRIPPPNPLTTVSVWIAAIFIAVREGAAKAPQTSGFAEQIGGAWSYLPLGVMALAAVVYLVRLVIANQPEKSRSAIGATPAASPALSAPLTPSPPTPPPKDTSVQDLAKQVIEASNALAASRPKPPDPNIPKSFVPESFVRRYIDAIDQDRTELQIDALLRPHLNHWMRMEARLERSAKRYEGISVMLSNPGKGGARQFWVTFHVSWSTHLTNVNSGEIIKIATQIVDTGYRIELMNAELL